MIVQADARHIPLADNSVQCVVTSPPYFGLRDYGVPGQLGLERTPEEYVANMVSVFREVKRVLREDGTCWVNMGDGYANPSQPGGGDPTIGNRNIGESKYKPTMAPGLKPKDLIGMPWRLAFALQADGWYLRSDIIWAKPNPMPESVTDRPTKSHEYIFLLTKSAKYYFDQEAVRLPPSENANGECAVVERQGGTKFNENGSPVGARRKYDRICGANTRTVWSIATQPYPEAHFATFPEEIPKRCILAGTSARGACAKCGAPWERVVERETTYDHVTTAKGKQIDGPYAAQTGNGVGTHDIRHGVFSKATTTGWYQACGCRLCDDDHCGEIPPVVPCIVLDPFAGSGTTVAVADSLGRRGIGLELKPEYIALARKRTRTVTLGLPL